MESFLKHDTAVIVFARAPVPGRVKTRLIPALGAEAATDLYRRMLEHAVASAAAAAVGPVRLCVSANARHPCLRELASRFGCELLAQVGADLGVRMHHATSDALTRHSAVLLIGSDCPARDEHDLRAAARALADGAEVVLGPASDGGYVLIGLRAPAPTLFTGVSWGGPEVLDQTRARLRAADLRWRELAVRRDIDEPRDLPFLPEGWLARPIQREP